jgi:hypothetical protein
MADFSTDGWLPVEIELDPQPAIVSEAAVRWLQFGSTPLAEPFFSQTAEMLRSALHPAREIETNIETMLRMGRRLPSVRPAGLIFHVSHCGSTLLANALRLAPNTVVASEPYALVRLTRRYADPPSAYLKQRWEASRRAMLDGIIRLYAHYRTGQAEPVVVKFSSLNLMGMKVVRACWPEVPCVVLVRNPAEVLVTAAASEHGWLKWKSDGKLAREVLAFTESPETVEAMGPEEYCARVLGKLLASALEAVDENCKVIDYEDLNRQRIRDVANFFGLALPDDGEAFDHVLSHYAKDPERRLSFQNDSARKRRMASAAMHEAAKRWAMPAYHALRGKGLW